MCRVDTIGRLGFYDAVAHIGLSIWRTNIGCVSEVFYIIQ